MLPNDVLAIIAMAGCAFYMLMGYVNKRAENLAENQTTQFKTGYLVQTIMTCIVGGLAYANAPPVELTFAAGLMALFSGIGLNAGYSIATKTTSNLNNSTGGPKDE